MDEAYLGISLWDHGPDEPYQVAFDDYSLRPQLFRYGPQPPDFNGTAFDLKPVKDKDDSELGVAMFFSHLFDKIVICMYLLCPYDNFRLTLPTVPADALNPDMGQKKRSVPASQLRRRGNYPPLDGYLRVADQPWYCFWNATIEEFWIFLEQDISTTSTSSAAAMQTSPPSSVITTAPSSLSTTPSASTYGEGFTLVPATTETYSDSYGSAPTDTWGPPKMKRSSSYSDSSSNGPFPKLVKMVEKRKPHSNIQPYCQKMQVLDNWQIMPIPDIPTICIDEAEYAQPTGSKAKRWAPRRRDDSTQELESNCICEWFSAPEYDP